MGVILTKIGARYLMFLGAVAIADTVMAGYDFSKKAIEWHKNRKALKADLECHVEA